MTSTLPSPAIAPRANDRTQALQSFLLFSGIALLPIYIFPSGSAQPSHMVLAIFAALTVLRVGFRFVSWNLMLLLLATHALLIELVYVSEFGPDGLVNAVFLFYNMLISYAVYRHVGAHGERAVALGLVVASALAVASVLYLGVELEGEVVSARSTGGFNNPNQLGYFSVCLLSLTYVVYVRRQLSGPVAIGLFAASTFMAIASLSKAAMVANFLVLFVVVRPIVTRRSAIVWLGFLAAAAGGLAYLLQSGALDEFFFLKRLDTMFDEGDSSLASRGYYVFLEGDSLQTVFGLGSGYVLETLGHEVHSTFFAILSNYGVVGLGLFLAAMVIWAKAVWRGYGAVGLVCIVGPTILYGITHNGSRFTIFWLLFAVSIAPHAIRPRGRGNVAAASSTPQPAIA